jgi:hypothetical protein
MDFGTAYCIMTEACNTAQMRENLGQSRRHLLTKPIAVFVINNNSQLKTRYKGCNFALRIKKNVL